MRQVGRLVKPLGTGGQDFILLADFFNRPVRSLCFSPRRPIENRPAGWNPAPRCLIGLSAYADLNYSARSVASRGARVTARIATIDDSRPDTSTTSNSSPIDTGENWPPR